MLETIAQSFSWLIDQINGEHAVIIASVTYIAMLLTERLFYLVSAIRRSEWDEKDAATNIGTILLSNILGTLILGASFVILYQFIYQFRLFDLSMAVWWTWPLAFAVHEFCYYLDHRLAHRIGLFWIFHQVHHASNRMNLSVAARGSFLDGLMQWTYWVIAPLLGVSLVQLLIVRFFTNIWGIFNHTRLVHRMGFLENWLATPANHRVHHGRQTKYLDKNYGQVTVIYDRLFGSFQPEEEEPDYGLVKRFESYNPIMHQFVGFQWMWEKLRTAPDWKAAIGYLVMPPGWSHDGEHQRTEDMIAREECIVTQEQSTDRVQPLPAE